MAKAVDVISTKPNFYNESETLFNFYEVVPLYPGNGSAEDLVDWYYHIQLTIDQEIAMRSDFGDGRVDDLLADIMQSETVKPSLKLMWQSYQPLNRNSLDARKRMVEIFALIHNAGELRRCALDIDIDLHVTLTTAIQ
jgi:hypothetical protein